MANKVKASPNVNPSALMLDGKLLARAISHFAKARETLERNLHIYACSAVALAARDGRCDWLNSLHGSLSKAHQDAMRAWLNYKVVSPIFSGKPWIEYSNEDGYSILPDTVANRPTVGRCQEVANDFDLSFVHKGAKSVAAELDWRDSAIKRLKGVVKALKAQETEHKGSVPQFILVDADALIKEMEKALKPTIIEAEPADRPDQSPRREPAMIEARAN